MRPEAAIVTDIVRIGGSGDDDHLNEFTEILEFNAADMVQSWILDDQTNFGLRIECDLCHTLGIHFGNEDVTLALKVCNFFLKNNIISHSGSENLKKSRQKNSAIK